MTYLLRERVIEEKKRQGLSTKTMAERSRLHLPEETISRFLSGKTADPGLGTAIDIAGTVGLLPHEAFMDHEMAEEFRRYLELKAKFKEYEEEKDRMKAELVAVKDKLASLSAENDILRVKLDLKDEIIAIHKHYNKIIPTP